MRHLPFPVLCLSLISATVAVLPLLAEPPPEVNVTIKTKPAQMKYDVEQIKAAPGAKVTITLQNDDDLPHNLVVCKPKDGETNDKGMDVAMQAWNMGEAGMKKDWIPENPRIIASTKLVNPHQSQTIIFMAPDEAAAYPFVCTFPGHAMVMNGTLNVSQPVPPIKNLHYRYYTGKDIKNLPEISTLTSVEEGQLPLGKVDVLLKKDRKKDYFYEFEGSLDCPKDGDYKFNIGSDDGCQVWIDGKELVKIDGIHPANFKEKKIKLTRGGHGIKVHYFQASGGAELYLVWNGPGFKNEMLSVQEPGTDRLEDDKDKFYGIPLVVGEETRIYRNFIAGSGPRGIAVGYPGGVNLCWDADQMNVALVWQGAFMDAKRHWTARGSGDQPPLGYGVAHLGGNRSLGIMASQTDPWVQAYNKAEMRDMAYTFHGYELDPQRKPTFKWQFNDITVEENFTPRGSAKGENAGLKRTLKLTAKDAPANLHFLALAGSVEARGSTFIVDKVVKVTVSSAAPIIKKAGDDTQIILPVVFKDGTAELAVDYSWSVK